MSNRMKNIKALYRGAGLGLLAGVLYLAMRIGLDLGVGWPVELVLILVGYPLLGALGYLLLFRVWPKR